MPFLEFCRNHTTLACTSLLLAACLVSVDIVFYGSLRDFGWPGFSKAMFLATLASQLVLGIVCYRLAPQLNEKAA
jgi:hypothetical protein